MQPEMMPPEQGGQDEQMVDGIIAAVGQLLQVAGPEWVMEAMQGLMEVAQGGETGDPDMMQEPPMMSQPRPMGNAFAQG